MYGATPTPQLPAPSNESQSARKDDQQVDGIGRTAAVITREQGDQGGQSPDGDGGGDGGSHFVEVGRPPPVSSRGADRFRILLAWEAPAAVLVGEYRRESYRLLMNSLDGIDSAISDFSAERTRGSG